MQQTKITPVVSDFSKRRYWPAFVIPALMVLAMACSEWSDLRQFNENEPFIEAQGTVAKLDCHNHGQYQVSFQAAGRTLTSESGNLYLRDNCGYLSVGQTVPVWYSTQDPRYVSFIPPQQARSYMKNEIVMTLLIGYPLMAGLFFLGIRFSSRKQNAT